MNNDDQSMATASASQLAMTQCPYWGQGGQYRRDPVTGQRTRIEAQAATDVMATPAAPAAEASAELADGTNNNQPKKEKTRG